MIGNSNVIRRQDCERYEILIPFSVIARKRKKQFLSSELEKMHPCFSDEFIFDSCLKSIKKRGVNEQVFVMNKYKLAEYEGKRRFPGAGFYIENHENQKKHCTGHLLFLNIKWKLTFLSMLSFLLVSAAGIISGIYAEKKNKKLLEAESNKMLAAAGTATNTSAFVSTETLPEGERLLQLPEELLFFDSVYKADGKISRFKWKIEGYNQSFEAYVKNVFPEELGVFAGDTVIYEKGIPQMNIHFSKRLQINEPVSQILSSGLGNADFNKAVRNILLDYSAVLKEESAPPYHIAFICKTDSELEKLFESLSEIITENKRCLSSFEIWQSGFDELSLELSIENLSFEGFDLGLISRNLKLFIEDRKELKPSTKSVSVSVSDFVFESTPDLGTSRNDVQKKLGEIKKTENERVVFYLNPEGKMKSFVEKSEREAVN